jgi:diaminopimelate epimerase
MPSPPRSTSWETDPVQLSKHHGLGNDFLVALDEVNDRVVTVDGDLARRVCDRRTGIGGDGLIHGASAPDGSDASVVMHLYNADGGRAETSGNGIRCLAHAVALAREVTELHLDVGTDAGPRPVVVRTRDSEGRVAWTEAAMGKALPGPEIPPAVVALLSEAGPARAHRFATADIGNPHLVVEVDDPSALDLAAIGPALERHFGEGINVEFVPARADVTSIDVPMRVWERGAGITEACGSGACAVMAVLHEWGAAGYHDDEQGRVLHVHMPGGSAYVALTDDGELVLSGDVHHVATIELPDD